MPICLKWFVIASRRKMPISPYLTFPDASRSWLFAIRSWPAPSATTITAWLRRSSRCCSADRNLSRVNGTSGTRQKFTWVFDQGRIRRDEPRIAAHELHESDPVARRFRLGVGRIGRAPRLGDGTLESKRSLHERDVVVDRFRDADDADLQATARRFLADLLCPAKRPVAADGEEDPDAKFLHVVHHFRRVLGPSGRPEDGSAALVDPVDGFGRQLERLVPNPAHEAFVPEAEAVDLVHAVVVAQAQDDRADHVVQSGAETAAGHDPARELRRIEEQHAPRSGGLHRGRCRTLVQPGVDSLERGVKEHALLGASEPDAGHRRLKAALAEPRYREIEIVVAHSSSLPTHCIIVVPADRSSVVARTTRAAIAFSARVM